MSRVRMKWLLSFIASAAILGIGYLANRVLDWNQEIAFFPTGVLPRVLPSDLFGADTFPIGIQLAFLIFHLLFWAVMVFLILKRVPR